MSVRVRSGESGKRDLLDAQSRLWRLVRIDESLFFDVFNAVLFKLYYFGSGLLSLWVLGHAVPGSRILVRRTGDFDIVVMHPETGEPLMYAPFTLPARERGGAEYYALIKHSSGLPDEAFEVLMRRLLNAAFTVFMTMKKLFIEDPKAMEPLARKLLKKYEVLLEKEVSETIGYLLEYSPVPDHDVARRFEVLLEELVSDIVAPKRVIRAPSELRLPRGELDGYGECEVEGHSVEWNAEYRQYATSGEHDLHLRITVKDLHYTLMLDAEVPAVSASGEATVDQVPVYVKRRCNYDIVNDFDTLDAIEYVVPEPRLLENAVLNWKQLALRVIESALANPTSANFAASDPKDPERFLHAWKLLLEHQ